MTRIILSIHRQSGKKKKMEYQEKYSMKGKFKVWPQRVVDYSRYCVFFVEYVESCFQTLGEAVLLNNINQSTSLTIRLVSVSLSAVD